MIYIYIVSLLICIIDHEGRTEMTIDFLHRNCDNKKKRSYIIRTANCGLFFQLQERVLFVAHSSSRVPAEQGSNCKTQPWLSIG